MPVDDQPNPQALVYVSYAWGDDTPEGMEREKIVDELCEVLETRDRIVVGRDKRRQKIGDSIEDFAAQIARADLLLAVVSSKYLRSYHCMVEELFQMYLRSAYQRAEFQKKVCLLLLDDAQTDISPSQELIDHWSELELSHHSNLEKLDPLRTGSPHGWASLANIQSMQTRMIDMLSALKDIIMPRGSTAIQRNNFDALRDLIQQRLQEWTQWRAESGGIAADIRNTPLEPTPPDLQKPTEHCLALILQRGEVLEDDPQWAERESPWEVYSYSWESKLYHSAAGHYRDQPLAGNLGTYLLASTAIASPAAVSPIRSTFADLLQAAVDWIDRQPVVNPITLELFVPTELLAFDWAGIKIHGRSVYDEVEELCKRQSFTLRSAERFEEPALMARRSHFPKKYNQLLEGKGRWITGPSAVQLDKLRESEEQDDLVALKRLVPLDSTPRAKLIWQRRVVEAMLPMAIWWRSPEPNLEQARQLHLDAAYEGLLSGNNDGDPVPWSGCHLDKLPRLRRSRITDPLTKGLVLLLDRPDRHPWSETSPTRSL